MLDQTSARIIVFNAPAGYGKTTLAAEWLQDHDSVTWYRATPASADVAAFSLGLAESLSEVTSAGTRLRRRLEIAESPEAAIDGLAKLLAEDLREWPDDGWIVLDDYHLAAESSAVESFLNCLLTLVPVRMVVTTRRRPRWLSARQVLYGEVLEFTHETLAMTRVEAEQTLETHAFNDSQAVVDRAAGWPALLGLAALAGSTALPEERMSEVLFRYFAEEVLRSAPAEIQRFMLRASVPVDVRLPSARDVLGIADPSELVERLRLEGLLEPVDGAFRFHPLLQEFLRQKLETEEPETAADIYVAAIEHCMSTRSWEAAFALAERSQALEKKEQILLAAAPELFATGRLETLGNWIDHVESDSPEVRPQVKLVRAEWLLRRGRFAGALKAAQEVTAGSHDETWFTSKAFLISGQAAHFVADDVAALKFHRLARETATTKDEYANATWGAFVASGALESEDARGFLDEYEGAAAGDPDKRLRALAGREIVAGLEGSYASVIPLLVQMYELSRESRDPMARTNALSTVVWLNVLQGKYRVAASMSDEALAYTRTLGIGFAEAFFLALRASAEVGLRQVSAARRTLESLQKTDAWADDPYLQTAHATLVVKLAITEGKPEDALVGAYEPTRIHFSEYGEYLATRAIAYASLGEAGEATRLASAADELSRCAHIRFSSRFARLLADLATERTASGEEPNALLQQAHRAGCVDPFVMSYRSHPALLGLLTERSRRTIALPAIEAADDRRLAKKVGLRLDEDADGKPRLTAREQEVQSLMRSGLTNAEIARRLVISPSTAKVHARNVLRKYGVRTRVELATAAADEDLRSR